MNSLRKFLAEDFVVTVLFFLKTSDGSISDGAIRFFLPLLSVADFVEMCFSHNSAVSAESILQVGLKECCSAVSVFLFEYDNLIEPQIS